MIFGHYTSAVDFVVAEYYSATYGLAAGGYKDVVDFVVAKYNSATCCSTADG